MRITWYGHSAFLVEAGDGTRIILDPYRSGAFGGGIAYAPIDDPADAVIATHTHEDHGAVDTIPGGPAVYVEPTSARAGSVRITGIPVQHDPSGGSERGRNTIVVLDDSGVRLAHLGDLGHELDRSTVEQIGRVDVVMVPVGGYFTIDAAQAAQVVAALAPRVVIPMHYKTPKCGFPIDSVDGFLATQPLVETLPGSTLSVTADDLPPTRTTYVLQHAR